MAERSKKEIEKVRDAALLRALKTPPKPHEKISGKANKKPKPKRKPTK